MVPHVASEITALARNTTLYAWEFGKEAALTDINSGSSQLLAVASGNITHFAAVDMRGIVLANAFVPECVGQNIFRLRMSTVRQFAVSTCCMLRTVEV